MGTEPLALGWPSLHSTLGIMQRSLALEAGRYHERLLKGVSNLMIAGESWGDNIFFSGLLNREHGGGAVSTLGHSAFKGSGNFLLEVPDIHWKSVTNLRARGRLSNAGFKPMCDRGQMVSSSNEMCLTQHFTHRMRANEVAILAFVTHVSPSSLLQVDGEVPRVNDMAKGNP